MKIFRIPFILMTVILVLAGLAYWDEWKTSRDDKLKTAKDRLTSLKAESVKSITYIKQIDQNPTLTIKLEKNSGKWQIMSPGAFAADSETIDRWLKTLEDLRFEKTFEVPATKLKEYGLEKPQISIVTINNDGKPTRIEIGSKSPVGYSSYVRVDEGASVFLVSQYLATSSNKELQDFRDKTLGFPDMNKVQKLSFKSEAEAEIVMTKHDKEWQIESPQPSKADSAEVLGFLAFLEKQRVDRFIDKPSPEMQKALVGSNSGNHALARLSLFLEGGQQLDYDFIENNGIVYTQIPGQTGFVALDRKIEEGLKKRLIDFQFSGMFSFNSTEATAVIIDGKTYEKKDDRWIDQLSKEPGDFIRLLLVDLEFAKAEQILSQDKFAAILTEKPLHSLRLQFKDDSKISIAMWKNPGNPETIFLKRGEEAYFLAKAQILDNFQSQTQPQGKVKIGGEG